MLSYFSPPALAWLAGIPTWRAMHLAPRVSSFVAQFLGNAGIGARTGAVANATTATAAAAAATPDFGRSHVVGAGINVGYEVFGGFRRHSAHLLNYLPFSKHIHLLARSGTSFFQARQAALWLLTTIDFPKRQRFRGWQVTDFTEGFVDTGVCTEWSL